jgi:DNA mismatch endonuclease (patch repair protein)
MADIFSKKKRSEIMSRIRAKNTKAEVEFRKKVWAAGLRYRLYSKKLPGKPDFVFTSKKLVVFLDGCFWHKCPQCFKRPKSNKKYWDWKIKYNVDKDKRVNRKLRKAGWKVIRFWEHDAKKNPAKCVKKIIAAAERKQQ